MFQSHAQPETLALSHRIAVMDLGRIEQLDKPSHLYNFPKNRFVADFIGNCNLLESTEESRLNIGDHDMVCWDMTATRSDRLTRQPITAPPTLFLLAFFLAPALTVVRVSAASRLGKAFLKGGG